MIHDKTVDTPAETKNTNDKAVDALADAKTADAKAGSH
jgi:hypothetical protein